MLATLTSVVALAVCLLAVARFGHGWLTDPAEKGDAPPLAPARHRGDDPRLPTVPGEEHDRELEAATRGARFRRELRAHLHERLVAEHGATEQDAVALIESGTWTDDPYAAAALHDEAARVPLRRQLRLWVSGRTVRETLYEHAVAAVDDLDPGDVSLTEVPTDAPSETGPDASSGDNTDASSGPPSDTVPDSPGDTPAQSPTDAPSDAWDDVPIDPPPEAWDDGATDTEHTDRREPGGSS